MGEDKTAGLIGLAMKAGRLVHGETACENAVRKEQACLVILAKDASGNTEKKFRDKCSWYRIPLTVCFDKAGLGRMIGKEQRAVLAVTDPGFAEAIQKQLDRNNNEPEKRG